MHKSSYCDTCDYGTEYVEFVDMLLVDDEDNHYKVELCTSKSFDFASKLNAAQMIQFMSRLDNTVTLEEFKSMLRKLVAKDDYAWLFDRA